MKAVIYARFSTDKQRESSIEDQVRICKARAAFEKLDILRVFSDEGVSGTTWVASRPGSAAMMDAARDRAFDVLIIEGLDRLARDSVEQETTVRMLEFWGIRLVGVADGYDSLSSGKKLHRGMRGLINEIYIDDLRHKTHRGLSGQVDRGFIAGAAPYGYRIIKDENGSRLEIEEKQADVVRWIYKSVANGWSFKRIIADLNRRCVPSPRGGLWMLSSIAGAKTSSSGILHNQIYRGTYIWNRSQWIKSPETGKRKRILRPESEWVVRDRPELRIIDENVWNQVETQQNDPAHPSRGRKGRPASALLTGTIKCGHCGGPMIAYSHYSYGCSLKHNSGPTGCKGVTVPKRKLEGLLLNELRVLLTSKTALQQLQQEVAAMMAEQAKNGDCDMAAARKRTIELEAEIERLVEAIASVGISDSLRSRLLAAEQEKKKLATQVATSQAPLQSLDASEIVAYYRELLSGLDEALNNADSKDEARLILRELFGEVLVTRDEEGQRWAEMKIAAISAATSNVVAGAGFEPTTFGL